MDNKVLRVGADFSVDRTMKVRMSEEDLEHIIKRNLTQGVSRELINLIDIPEQSMVHYESEFVPVFGCERYRLRLNLISDAELKRLKDIERKYDSIHALTVGA